MVKIGVGYTSESGHWGILKSLLMLYSIDHSQYSKNNEKFILILSKIQTILIRIIL